LLCFQSTSISYWFNRVGNNLPLGGLIYFLLIDQREDRDRLFLKRHSLILSSASMTMHRVSPYC
jgi:hypothetical protein